MPPPATFGIPAHIHVCSVGTGTVILDVRRDRYLGLGQEESEWLAELVAGWPRPVWQRSKGLDAPAISRVTNELCESLFADGVLEKIPAGRQARKLVPLGDMRGDWISIGDELEVVAQVKFSDIAKFFAAFVWARYSLAWRPFEAVVEEVRARKRKHMRDMDLCDLSAIATTVDIFRRLRPFAFAAEGRCLLHALTLTRFLSGYQLHPEWMIGVTLQPWGAHSWVQWGRFLLDTNPEKVCAYTPIMRV